MTDKLLSIIGLARRAGKATLGCDPVLLSIQKGRARLMLTACDISDNTLSRVAAAADASDVPHIPLDFTKQQISLALGKLTAVFSIDDEGFAKTIEKLSQQ